MNTKNQRKIGFWGAVILVLSSVVGASVFFINRGVSRATNYEGITTMLAWIIGGVIALFAALSFSEIGTIKHKNLSGLPGWAEKLGGKRFGQLVKFNYSFFYLGALLPIIAFFASEYLFEFLYQATEYKGPLGLPRHKIEIPPVWVHVIVSIFILTIVLCTSKLSIIGNKIGSLISQIFAWSPIIIVVITALMFIDKHNTTAVHQMSNTFENHHVTIKGLIVSLPLVLFAYDAFLNIGVESHRAKNGVKTISAAITVGMILAIALYTALAIASSFHTGLDVLSVVNDYANIEHKKLYSSLIYGAIFGATLFGLNTLSFITHDTFELATKDGVFFSNKKVNPKNEYIYNLIFTIVFWFVVGIIPSAVRNNDKYTSFVALLPTLFFFCIYAITIVYYIIQRDKFKPETAMSKKLYLTISIIAVTLITVSVGYTIIYEMIIQKSMHLNDTVNPYGLLLNDGLFDTTLKNSALLGMFIGFSSLFFLAPIINYSLINKFRKGVKNEKKN